MYLVLLGIVLLVLKVVELEPVAAWSWYAVLAPFAAAVLWWQWADRSGFSAWQIVKRQEARKRERRRRALELLKRPPDRR